MKTHATYKTTAPEQAPPTNGTVQFNDQRPVTQRVTQLQDSANAHTVQRKANKTGLPDNLKSGIESLSGYAMDDVKVHYNSSKPAQLQAHAYAQGTDIHVAPGQERHLPHEAWHVVQQKQGRVKPTMQMKGTSTPLSAPVNVNDDAGLEREADVMGSKALQMKKNNFSRMSNNLIDSKIKSSVSQLATIIVYDNEPDGKKGESKIKAIGHERSSVNSAAKNKAFEKGQWKDRPKGSVANHSKPYSEIETTLITKLSGETLADASVYLANTFGKVPYITAAGNHQQTLNNLHDKTKVVGKGLIASAFDYFISRIADYPGNIFYWPDQTNGNPDEPQTDYGTGKTAIPAGWKYNATAASADSATGRPNPPIDTEKTKLTTGRSALTAAGL